MSQLATSSTVGLDSIHHVAIPVTDLESTVSWYLENFASRLLYQDKTWALLEFANTRLAFVVPEQHPAHVAFERPDAERFGPLTGHRDGTRSTYVEDPSGNAVEILESESDSHETGFSG
jgi:catechol 2,3-dioxygenase-like lactoylglutathione lyase family enzyme